MNIEKPRTEQSPIGLPAGVPQPAKAGGCACGCHDETAEAGGAAHEHHADGDHACGCGDDCGCDH
ncbi:MAG: hypothetical protein IT534_08795 [Bauldia sp.]|nr:hypothetical protein [Bauldia sp.]